jgi:hypothetical protein
MPVSSGSRFPPPLDTRRTDLHDGGKMLGNLPAHPADEDGDNDVAV